MDHCLLRGRWNKSIRYTLEICFSRKETESNDNKKNSNAFVSLHRRIIVLARYVVF